MGDINTIDCWYIKKPELLTRVQQEIKTYPTLRVVVENNKIFIRGKLQILSPAKTRVIDDFSIEIEFPNNFPMSIPIVRETGGRIPPTLDRHNPRGVVCLFVPEDGENYYQGDGSIINFIENCVTPFFIGQSYYQEKGEWLFGERPHGIPGVIDYYREKFGDKAATTFEQYLWKREIKGHWLCYCGSGKRMRKCHMRYLIYYRLVCQTLIKNDKH